MTKDKRTPLMKLVEKMIDVDPAMRFAAIIDLRGNILESIMKSGKTSLKSQKEEEHFCVQVAQRRKMRQQFDKSLGKVSYVHVEREKVTQLVVYPKRKTVYFTLEPKTSVEKKMTILGKIKKLTANI